MAGPIGTAANLLVGGVAELLRGRVQRPGDDQDRDGNIWVGKPIPRGLLRLNQYGVSSLDPAEDRSHEAITAVFEDREGNLWTGSASGIERLRDSAFTTYSRPEGLPSDGSKPIFVDSEDRRGLRPWTADCGG